jgi:hypothetical protein
MESATQMQKEIFSVNVEQVPQVLNVNLVNKLCDLKKKMNKLFSNLLLLSTTNSTTSTSNTSTM